MSDIKNTAELFVEAADAGKGWEVCQAYCHADATFACQAPVFDGVTTLEAYVKWAADLLTPVPDGHTHVKSFAADHDRNNVIAYAVFHGTQTGEGGPVPPTGKTVASDYVYVMFFEGDRIKHMTKIWNDGVALQQLGWA